MYRTLGDQRVLAGNCHRNDLVVDNHYVANVQCVARVIDTDLTGQLLVAESLSVVDAIKPELTGGIFIALGNIEEHRAVAAYEWPFAAT
ncbi:hypothetical protein D3C77_272380 [compost metagenome]